MAIQYSTPGIYGYEYEEGNGKKTRPIEDYLEDGITKGIYPPVYYGTEAEAKASGDDYPCKESRMLDNYCCDAIRHFLFARLDRPIKQDETDDMIRKWGVERLSYNLACTILYAYPASSFSADTVRWANTVPMSKDPNWDRQNVIASHPVNLDRFASQIREHIRLKALAEEEQQEQNQTHTEEEMANLDQAPPGDTEDMTAPSNASAQEDLQPPAEEHTEPLAASPEEMPAPMRTGTLDSAAAQIQQQAIAPQEIYTSVPEGQDTETVSGVEIQVPVPKRKAKTSKTANPDAPKRKPRKPRKTPLKPDEMPAAQTSEEALPKAVQAQEEGQETTPDNSTNNAAEDPAEHEDVQAGTGTPATDTVAGNTAAAEDAAIHITEEYINMATRKAETLTADEDSATRTVKDTRTEEELARQAEELEKQWAEEDVSGFAGTNPETEQEEIQPMADGAGNGVKDTEITMQIPENDDLHSTYESEEGDLVPPHTGTGVVMNEQAEPAQDTASGTGPVQDTSDNELLKAEPAEAKAPKKKKAVHSRKKSAPVETTEQTAAEQAPADAPVSQTSAETTAEQTPEEMPASQTPTETPASQTPAETTAEQTSAETTAEQAPAEMPAAQEPAEQAVTEAPAETLAEAAEDVAAVKEDSAVKMEETAEENPFVTDSTAPPAAPAPAPAEKPGNGNPAPVTERNGNGEKKTVWFNALVSEAAMIRRYEKSTFMRMPLSGKYAGYTYNYANRFMDTNMVKVSKAPAAGTENAISLSFPETFTFSLSTKDEGKEPVTLTAREFFDAVNGSMKADYVAPRRKRGERTWFTLRMPAESYMGTEKEGEADMFVFSLPDRGKGDSFHVPAFLGVKQANGDYIIHVPDDTDVRLWNKHKSAGRITPQNLKDVVLSAKPEEYLPAGEEGTFVRPVDEKYVTVPKEAKICDTAASRLFRMPDGKYEKFSYYYPISLTEETEDGYRLRVPNTMPVRIFADQDVQRMPAELFAHMLKGENTYTNDIQRPTFILRGKILTHERQLRENVPEEMKARPNWVVLRTRENSRTGHLDKFLINPKTGKFAESDNPETWTDFETAIQYAKAHGGDTIAYALDGKDGICCLDVDNCLDEDGKFTPAAQRARSVVPAGCYTETSVSGKGMHFFGKMEPSEVRSFSKDGKMEFYRKAHFISMTGACREGETKLESFDTPDMRYFIRNNFDKRPTYKKTGQGIDGLSKMSDRDILERAFMAKGGDITMQLYNGVDVRHNHSNSDMALMNRLAFWCNGDREQMMRIFSTSGLYRPEKSQDYYECTIIKAILETPDRFDPEEYRRKAEEKRAAEDRAAGRKYLSPKEGASGASSARQSASSRTSSASGSDSQQEKVIPGKPVYGRYGNVKGYTEAEPVQDSAD